MSGRLPGVAERAAALDAADPLAWCRAEFVEGEPPVRAYLDGNSLGRPLRATAARLQELVVGAWGTRLIRSWDEQWMQLPLELGDHLGRVCLGAAPGQVFVGDSTTVLLYKLLRAAVADAMERGRPQLVLDTENFPTNRYVAEGVAAETGAELVWLSPDPARGVELEHLREHLGERTGVVLVSHVAYKSSWRADLAEITAAAREHGALVLWDLCHSAGVLPVDLDAADVDLAVGCSYKFLNAGPGGPAFGYVATRLQQRLSQPVQGWMGHAEPFVMGPGYRPAEGVRRFISGTPPVLAMAGLADTVELVDRVGLEAVTTKALALGAFVVEVVDEHLAGLGVGVASPRDPGRRGAHVTLTHPDARELCRRLWEVDVVPDFREPDVVRLGLAPLSTSYAEVATALEEIARLLD
ncbi:kynureninase [Auraticoccus monumenti]|uniref:Kynureninase n=1 Tax=Auraticoccus monumenti TaxID=675864 RepID=A0A1G7A4W6_9ACTN|nr:aminotransferase class V-fold PLP-dependent enzyme [Auraticoccus monumenti]SDE09791.1 Kynureninase [Auraticoccus monumenti]